jgi:hypothetical protein
MGAKERITRVAQRKGPSERAAWRTAVHHGCEGEHAYVKPSANSCRMSSSTFAERCLARCLACGGREYGYDPLLPYGVTQTSAPRCGARIPTGTPCQRPAIRGRKRCRLHGGLNPGRRAEAIACCEQ